MWLVKSEEDAERPELAARGASALVHTSNSTQLQARRSAFTPRAEQAGLPAGPGAAARGQSLTQLSWQPGMKSFQITVSCLNGYLSRYPPFPKVNSQTSSHSFEFMGVYDFTHMNKYLFFFQGPCPPTASCNNLANITFTAGGRIPSSTQAGAAALSQTVC